MGVFAAVYVALPQDSCEPGLFLLPISFNISAHAVGEKQTFHTQAESYYCKESGAPVKPVSPAAFLHDCTAQVITTLELPSTFYLIPWYCLTAN